MNMNMDFERKLTIPMEVKKMYPLDDELRQIVTEREKQVQDIFAGKDDRIVLIIGPCSADREDSVLDYISRLREVQEKVSSAIENMIGMKVTDVNVKVAGIAAEEDE